MTAQRRSCWGGSWGRESPRTDPIRRERRGRRRCWVGGRTSLESATFFSEDVGGFFVRYFQKIDCVCFEIVACLGEEIGGVDNFIREEGKDWIGFWRKENDIGRVLESSNAGRIHATPEWNIFLS